MRPQTRSTVVRRSGGHGGLVEAVDGFAVRRSERNVRSRRLAALGDPEVGHPALAEAAGVAELHHELVAERLQCLLVELLAASVVADVQGDVVDRHCGSFRS
jgi:hypothetical protein